MEPLDLQSYLAQEPLAYFDEAGAGPLCGDLVVVGLILKVDAVIEGIKDSKKLTEKRREALFPNIISASIAHSIIHISPRRIDEINIFQARMEGFKRAAEALLPYGPRLGIIDGNKIPESMPFPCVSIVKADDKVPGVSAASVLAKVSRDRQIIELDKKYPQYLLAKHKGYGTAQHMVALNKYGPCEIYRFSYAPVRKAQALHSV